jgi:hypothetical protein
VDPSDEIMTELHQRLSLSYNGKSYPVYTVVPKNTAYNYVLMAPLDLIDDSTKDSNMYECTQLFDIVCFGGERGSWKAANSLAGQIMDEIMKVPIVTQNFKSTVSPIIDSTNNFVEDVEGGITTRKLIRFRYNIQQI